MFRHFVVTDSERGKLVSSCSLRYKDESDADIRSVFKQWANQNISNPSLMRVQSMPIEEENGPALGPIFSFYYRGGYQFILNTPTISKNIKFKYGYMVQKKNQSITNIITTPSRNLTFTDKTSTESFLKLWSNRVVRYLTTAGVTYTLEQSPYYKNIYWYGEIMIAIDAQGGIFLLSDQPIKGVADAKPTKD